MQVTWSDEKHSVGIAEIDEQHKELFLITNNLYAAKELRLPLDRRMAMQMYLKRLLAYVHFHFAAEEELMENCRYPELDAHAGLHAGFKVKILKLMEVAKEGGEPRLDELLDFLVHWIVFHVQDEDRKYVRYLRERGVQPVLHATPGGAERGRDVLSLWQEKHLALEIQEIDAQHKELVMVLQQANDLLRGTPQRQKSFLPGILRKLFYYTEFHFSFEEELMSRHGYPRLEEHRKLHDSFIAEVRGFLEAFKAGDEQLAGKIVEFLKDWIVTHILSRDADYKKYVKPE
jgi:hemerythrin